MTARQQCLLYLSQGERSDRSCDPGEGMRSIDRPYPLTPTLSPWERGRSELAVVAFFPDSRSDCVSPGGIRQ